MVRQGIYVGGKEITQRYVGNRLAWELRLSSLLNGTFTINKHDSSCQIWFGTYIKINANTAKKIIINGHKAPTNKIVIEGGGFSVKVIFSSYNDLITFWRDVLKQDSRYHTLNNATISLYG